MNHNAINKGAIAWDKIDTVLLDMDGTLLDLKYDNYVWNELVPAAYGRKNHMPLADAKAKLLAHMHEVRGRIEFYNFDYWTDYCEVDLVALHNQPTHLIQYRPGAQQFLHWARAAGKKLIIATNAHPDSVSIKGRATDLLSLVDETISSHEFQAPKEDQAFWQALQKTVPYDPKRTAFFDDNEPVLDAARTSGIQTLWCIDTPDSSRPTRQNLSYPSFNDFQELF